MDWTISLLTSVATYLVLLSVLNSIRTVIVGR